MDPSYQDKSNLDEIIFSRVRAVVLNLVNTKERIDKEGIKGDSGDNLKRLLSQTIEIVEQQVESVLDEIGEIQREDVKIRRSSRIHRVLEEFLYLLDLVQSGTQQIQTELGYLVRTALKELQHSDIKILIIPGSSLSTTNLSIGLEDLFEFFTDVRSFIQSDFPFYWIIYAPPSFTRAPLNWPLIGHEIGHILERQKWNLVKDYYPYPIVSSPVRLPYSTRDTKSYYAQEFQADFVALTYFGPIFARRLLAIYYTRELVISPTHPSWTERFGAIAQKLEETGFVTEASDLKAVSVEESSLISRDRIEHLSEIIVKTAEILGQENCDYNPNDIEEKKAASRLERLALYTKDMRTLLNVADKVLRKKKASISGTNAESRKRDLESDFDYILRDSIRLSYVKQFVQPAMDLDRNSTSS